MEMEMEEPEVRVVKAGEEQERTPNQTRRSLANKKAKLISSIIVVILSSAAIIFFEVDIEPLLKALLLHEDEESYDSGEMKELISSHEITNHSGTTNVKNSIDDTKDEAYHIGDDDSDDDSEYLDEDSKPVHLDYYTERREDSGEHPLHDLEFDKHPTTEKDSSKYDPVDSSPKNNPLNDGEYYSTSEGFGKITEHYIGSGDYPSNEPDTVAYPYAEVGSGTDISK